MDHRVVSIVAEGPLNLLERQIATDEIVDKAEEIARAFQDRQKTTQETLTDLENLLRQLADAEKRQAETDLTPDAFAVFWLLERQGVPRALEVAQGVASGFEQFPSCVPTWASPATATTPPRRSGMPATSEVNRAKEGRSG